MQEKINLIHQVER